jgi:hypothetical protein
MPTRSQYVAYLKSLEGGYGPNRGLANNDNPYNTWYYGHRVSGDNYAWCFVTECYAQNHFDILTLNGGKEAYCPNAKARAIRAGARVVTHPSSTAGLKPGDPVYYDFNKSGEPEHTGTFVKAINSTEFYAVEGNTATSSWSDALALKRRSIHDVLWHIELLGVDGDSTSEEDDVPKAVSLGVAKPPKVKTTPVGAKTVWNTLEYDTEYDDAGKMHADPSKATPSYPSVLTGPHAFAIRQDLHFAGLPEGTDLQVRAIEVDAKTNDYVSSYGIDERKGTEGDTYVKYNDAAAYVDKGHKVRVQFAVFEKEGLDLSKLGLKTAPMRLHYW